MNLNRISRLAAVGLALCCGAAAQAQLNYTSVTTDLGFAESDAAQPRVLVTTTGGGGSASVTADGLDLSARDSTHWTLGPYVAANRVFQFGVAGSAGSFETVTFQVAISTHNGNDLATSFNTSYSLQVELRGNADTDKWISGGLTDVNCLGCGGHLSSGSVTSSEGLAMAWPSDYQATLSFTTTVERGWNQAGRFTMSGSLLVNNSWADLSIDLLSITNSQGQALSLGSDGFLQAVPEPASSSMLALGAALLVGWRLMRQRDQAAS